MKDKAQTNSSMIVTHNNNENNSSVSVYVLKETSEGTYKGKQNLLAIIVLQTLSKVIF